MSKREFNTCSVIIPAYNAAGSILKTIESALTQTRPPDEIVVADDGSSDNTSELAESMGVKVLRLENGGPGRARNAAAQASTGELLFFLDADDTWQPNKIEMHLRAHQVAEPQPSFVFDLTQRIRPDGRFSGIAGVGRPGVVHWTEMLDSKNWTCGSCPSMPRVVFEAIGGFNESLWFAEDVEFLMRAGHQCGPGWRLNEVGTFYQLTGGSLSRKQHDPAPTLRIFKERLPYLTGEQEAQVLTTVVMVNALHAPPGRYLAAFAPMGLRILRERRFYRFMALRVLNAMGLRPI